MAYLDGNIVNNENFDTVKKRYLKMLRYRYTKAIADSRDENYVHQLHQQASKSIINFDSAFWPDRSELINIFQFQYKIGISVDQILDTILNHLLARKSEYEELLPLTYQNKKHKLLGIIKLPITKECHRFSKNGKLLSITKYTHSVNFEKYSKKAELHEYYSISSKEVEKCTGFIRLQRLYHFCSDLSKRKVAKMFIKLTAREEFEEFLKSPKDFAEKVEETKVELAFETKYGDESTTARQVLVMHYIFKTLGVHQSDATKRARIVQFLNNKNWDSIYNRTRSPLRANETELKKDLLAIKPLFQKVGLTSVVEQIEKEINSSE